MGLVFSHWTWLPPLRKQFAKVGERFLNSGHQVVNRLITPLRMSYEESYAKPFPFDKMASGMLDPEMIEDVALIMNEAIKEKIQVNLIINNRAGGNAPPDRPKDRRPPPFRKAAEAILSPLIDVKSSS